MPVFLYCVFTSQRFNNYIERSCMRWMLPTILRLQIHQTPQCFSSLIVHCLTYCEKDSLHNDTVKPTHRTPQFWIEPVHVLMQWVCARIWVMVLKKESRTNARKGLLTIKHWNAMELLLTAHSFVVRNIGVDLPITIMHLLLLKHLKRGWFSNRLTLLPGRYEWTIDKNLDGISDWKGSS